MKTYICFPDGQSGASTPTVGDKNLHISAWRFSLGHMSSIKDVKKYSNQAADYEHSTKKQAKAAKLRSKAARLREKVAKHDGKIRKLQRKIADLERRAGQMVGVKK